MKQPEVTDVASFIERRDKGKKCKRTAIAIEREKAVDERSKYRLFPMLDDHTIVPDRRPAP